MKMYLYIVECADGFFYTGVTSNIDRRIAQHNAGINPKAYTYKRRPVEVVFLAEYSDPYVAFEWEIAIKGWSRAKKMALIDGDWNKLHELAICQNATHYRNKVTSSDDAG